MSILDKITSILDTIEEMNGKLDRLLASGGEKEDTTELQTDPEWEKVRQEYHTKLPEPEPKKENTETEGESMDLTSVVLLKETPKAFLAFKKNMQIWVAKSHLEGGYDVGNTYDLKVKEKSKWILDKLDWKPFTVVKG